MNGRTWKNQDLDTLEKIKNQLFAIGGGQTEIRSPYELWRIKIADSVFIAFKTGTLYHTPSNSNSNEVLSACQEIDAITGTGYAFPSRDYFIGLDETGKGEIAGPVVLTGVVFHKNLFQNFIKLVGPADTKKLHSFQYWKEIYDELDRFRGEYFNFVVEKISPKLVDRYNVNHLLDLFYQKIISHLLNSVSSENCRIVLDDYGAGKNLRNLEVDNRHELLIVPKAEDQFIEAKVASLISKKIREGILENLNQLPEYRIDHVSIGNGNISNPQTTRWLSKWHASGRSWPWFIKQSFKTIKDLEGVQTGQPHKSKKSKPNLRDDLLPPEFVQAFHDASAKVNLSAIKCSNCHEFQEVIIVESNRMICRSCSKPMDDLQFMLSYYCGSLVTDPNILERNILINDLENGAFFENYRVIIPWTDLLKHNSQFVQGGKALKNMESLGRVDLEYYRLDNDANNILTKIITKAAESNSILIASLARGHHDGWPNYRDLFDLARRMKVLTCMVQ